MVKVMVATAAIVAATALPAWAADAQPGMDLVLFGGVSNSSFSGSDQTLLGDGSRTGATGGLAFMLRVNPDYGFEADVRVTQKGGEGQVDITDYTGVNTGPTIVGEGTTRLTYVEIPVMITAQLATGEKSFARAYFGPSFNILVSADFNGVIGGAEQTIDIEEGIDSFEYAIALGAGWVYDFGPVSGWVDGRWEIALSSIDDTGKDRDIKNQSWEFALGAGIPLARK
jgi:opacity protein-like surface antigen